MNIECGVVQGSTLLSYFVQVAHQWYDNSSNLINFTIHADDTICTYAKKKVEQTIPILNNEMLKVFVCLCEDHLTFNIEINKFHDFS